MAQSQPFLAESPRSLFRCLLHLAMATLAMGTRAALEAPWRSSFLSHIQELDSPAFVLSSLHAAAGSSPAPRARTVIFRGMWAGLPVNPKNTAELNADVYRTHLPTITTDARMNKTSQLLASADKSGGGGPVEANFWIPAAMTQWRFRGRAYVLGPDIDSDGAAHVREALAPYMHGNDTGQPWSWSKEVTAHFGNLSPGMRGTFKNPPPGTPRSKEPRPEEGLGLGQKVEDLNDSVARSNFRVVVIVPDVVQKLDLSDMEDARHWSYEAKCDGTGTWETTELWP